MAEKSKPRIAILLDHAPSDELKTAIQEGKAPRRDYFLLEDHYDASYIYPDKETFLGKLAYACTKLNWDGAWAGFKRREEFDLMVSVSEQLGLPLGALLSLSASQIKHVLLSHQPAAWKKIVFMYLTGAWRGVDRFVCYGKLQADLLKKRLKFLRDAQVTVILHPADHHFWKPKGRKNDKLVLAAGLEYRDYNTLLDAVRDLDAEVYIAASSPWSRRKDETENRSIPSNTTVGRLTQEELKQKQQRAAMVVVPLKNVCFQAGSLVMYEAMASGNAVVATRTPSHAEGEIIRDGENGILVEPNEPSALKQAIKTLLDDKKLRKRLGQAARKTVENGLNLDRYMEQLISLIDGLIAPRTTDSNDE